MLSAWTVLSLYAQRPIDVGKGSYAEYTPLYKSKTDQHAGDQSMIMENKELFLTDQVKGKPVPTNDWWTDLIVTRYSGNLWAYPQIVNAEEYGIYIEYPRQWTDDGREMKSLSRLEITGKRFVPEAARANGWNDWGLDFIMKDNEKQMRVTLAHGIPFTWVESQNLSLQLRFSNGRFFDRNGEISMPLTSDRFVLMLGDDAYGIYAPEGTSFALKNGLLDVTFTGAAQYLSIAVLPSKENIDDYAEYAYTVPRDTKVTWQYNEQTAKLKTTWEITTENLKGDVSRKNVLQGFIPHHYKRSELGFGFTANEYATPRGKMKMAAGNRFDITYDFNGILPYFAAPAEMQDLQNPYQRERMKDMISQYAAKGTFGGDTYWGGKGLTQMALYMTFAYEMGETALFEKCRTRLREVLENWLTFTPGEDNFFFARYNKWGALVGYNTSYDSDTFNDHHFHYGYYTYAASLLSLFDEDFRNNYGEMVTLLAKDYANWDRHDTNFPLFRTLDPWAGHSYAGGLGGWNGNGQESSSEAMQGWGGVYLQGVASGDKAMRDAGIFGWVLESRGTAEYWFDRDRENIDYTRYDKPYNSNLTSQGVGWWTWFSGDPVWMHSIQWMPISPALKYLYEDTEFAAWDYAQMWQAKEIGNWEVPKGLGDESGLGNVVLTYLQIFNPDSAASVFERLWNLDKPLAKNTDTGGISYYITHSHRTYGEIQWNIHADMCTSTAYYNDRTGQYTYMVYNPYDDERSCTFYKEGAPVVTFKAPSRKLTVYQQQPNLQTIEIKAPSKVVEPGKSVQLVAQPLDQYDATITAPVSWSATGNGTVSGDGIFTAAAAKGTATVRAVSGNVEQSVVLRIDDKPVIASASVYPPTAYLETGKTVSFSLNMSDQYNEPYQAPVKWSVLKDGQVVKQDSVFDLQEIATYQVKAVVENNTYTNTLAVLPPFPNLALKKQAFASSEENVGTKTVSATDGDKSTRWGSAHRDGEWIYVDLGEKCYVGYVSILWEAAYASLYELQVSDDAGSWETVQEITGQGGYISTTIDRYARYVRMLSLQRSTIYGTSLYEFEVYGVSGSGSPSDLFGLNITPKDILLKEGENVTLKATGYNRLGNPLQVPVTWGVDATKGVITTEGVFTPSAYGKITVSATSGDAKAETTYLVEESLKLTSIRLSPHTASVITGMTQPFEVATQNQFGVPYPADEIQYTVVGEGATFANGLFSANRSGSYILIAGVGQVRDTAFIEVAGITEINLALNKPATASSVENNGLLAQYVNDGDLATRWGSAFNDGEYVEIDLQDNYVLNKVRMFWQESYAASYRIDLSTDADNWKTVYSNLSCNGGNEEITIEPSAGRYLRIICMSRKSAYGSSLWEVEVYGSAIWTNPTPANIQVTPQPLDFYVGTPSRIHALIFDQYGLPMDVTDGITYVLNGGGNIASDGLFTPAQSGAFTLTVRYQSLVREFPIRVLDQKHLDRIIVSPADYKLKIGETVLFNAAGYDQYGLVYETPVIWSTDGGQISANGEFSAAQAGIYHVTASAESKSATVEIEVIEVTSQNLTLRKPVEVSSELMTGTNAVDGNTGTRWESAHSAEPQWITVDLEAAYHLTDIEVLWELASADSYEVQVSTDKVVWNTLHSVSGKTGARTDQLRVSGVGRYLRIYCTKRSTVWGYSILELRAFGVAMKTGEAYRIELTQAKEVFLPGETFNYAVRVEDMTGNEVPCDSEFWSVDGGGRITQSGEFTALEVGKFRLNVSCQAAQLTLPIVVFSPTGMNGNENVGISIIQENGKLRVRANDLLQTGLYDLTGKKVSASYTTHEDGQLLDTENLQGVYILVIRTKSAVESHKIVF